MDILCQRIGLNATAITCTFVSYYATFSREQIRSWFETEETLRNSLSNRVGPNSTLIGRPRSKLSADLASHPKRRIERKRTRNWTRRTSSRLLSPRSTSHNLYRQTNLPKCLDRCNQGPIESSMVGIENHFTNRETSRNVIYLPSQASIQVAIGMNYARLNPYQTDLLSFSQQQLFGTSESAMNGKCRIIREQSISGVDTSPRTMAKCV